MDIQGVIHAIQSDDNLTSYADEIAPAIEAEDCMDSIRVEKFVSAFTEVTLPALTKSPEEFENAVADISEACIQKNNSRYFQLAETIFSETKLIKWERRQEQANRMIHQLSELVLLHDANIEVDVIKSCVNKMMDVFTERKLTNLINAEVTLVLIACYRAKTELGVAVGEGLVSCYDLHWEVFNREHPSNKASAKEMTTLYDEMFQWIQGIDLTKITAESDFFCATISCLDKQALLAPAELSRIFSYCIAKDLHGSATGYSNIAHDIILVTVHTHSSQTDLIKDFIPGTVRLMNCGVKTLEEAAVTAVSQIYDQIDLLAQCADDVLQVYLDGKGGLSLGMLLKPLYRAAPDQIIRKMDKIYESFEDMDDIEKTYMYVLLGEIAKKHPKKILPTMSIVINDLRSASNVNLVFMVIAEVSNTYAEEISKYYKKLLQTWDRLPDVTSSAAKTLANIGLMSQDDANRCLRAMAKRLQTVGDENKSLVLLEMKRIGDTYKEVLNGYKANIEAEQYGTAPGLSGTVKLILDTMEGHKSLDVQHSGENTNEKTEDDIPNEQRIEPRQVAMVENNETPKGAKRPQKTIIKIPKWSRDLATIMNVEGEHDWRYLAIRLGYSSEGARNCALSPDPTMGILAEWYSTHADSDATFAILDALRDMERTRAVEILERALETAGEPPPKTDYETPDQQCHVFISHERDQQPEVEVIREHLEKFGYRCWVDIDRTGDGDSLHIENNHDAMRAAKVVLCIVTEKYAQSEHRRNEVHLATILNKPIISIVLNNIHWPPDDLTTTVLAQLLPVQLRSDDKRTDGGNSWPDTIFEDLLGQLAYYATSDINFNKDHQPDKPVGDETTSMANEVFISYQRDWQSAATNLHDRLTDSGYTCWMDLQQQHGTPIRVLAEKAISRTKIFIACFSTKYFLSSECRHQFNLADVLNKPILLVLTEGDTAWPVTGATHATLSKFKLVDLREGITDENYDLVRSNVRTHCNVTVDSGSAISTDRNQALTENDPTDQFADMPVLPEDKGNNVGRTGSVNGNRKKQLYSRPQSNAYIKHVSSSESSRSFPERSVTRARPTPNRADSDQIIPDRQSRRSAVCMIL